MEVRVRWSGEGVSFIGESGAGPAVVIDGPPDYGGRNLGPRPMELVLLGLGSCSLFDVVVILRKSRQPFTGCEVAISAERAEQVPRVFKKIHMAFRVRGEGVSREAAERAVRLSLEKYCSVAAMLRHVAQIDWSVEVVEGGDL